MTNRFTGGVISATAPTVSTSSASGVWNLEEAQYYQKAGVWPSGSGADPYFNYTTLLLHGDGTNGAQNNTFLDSSTNNFTITRNGNTTQGSFNPYVGPGCWSNYFDGSGDYLSAPSSTGFQFGTGDFTIETWAYWSATASTGKGILNLQSTNSMNFYWDGGSYLTNYLVVSDRLTNQLTYAFTPIVGTWYHLAVARSGTNLRLFVNGVLVQTTASNTTNYGLGTVNIGGDAGAGASWSWNGYLSNFRVVKGQALYTATFTPSTKPIVATSQTTLLTCNSNGFNDQSAANNVLTRNGDTAVSKFSPFSLYQTVPTSYSGYFDGNGDYLTVPSNAAFTLGAGSFTIEAWVYCVSTASQQTIVERRGSAFVTGDWALFCNESPGNFTFYAADISGTAVLTGSGLVANTWTHIAIVRNTNAWAMYVNGVSAATTTSSATIADNSQVLSIGKDLTVGTRFYFNGSISNLRITKGQALYTSAFTPSTSPLTTTSQGATAANVSLLTCQSTTFIDNSTNAFTITANGNATPKRANPFTDSVTGPTPYSTTTYGGSAYFDGTGDYLVVPDSANLELGSGNFTIEMWVFVNATAQASLLAHRASSVTSGPLTLFKDSSNVIRMYLATGAAGWDILNGAAIGTVTNGQWYHVSVCRSGTSFYGSLNGVVVSLGTSASAIGDVTANWSIGADLDPTNFLNGYISNLRLIKGTALYTTPFVPPAAPVTAITNTQLLVNATNGGIFDNTTINDLETVGNAQISTSVVKYGTGSMSFSSGNSYLVTPTIPATTFLAPNTWTIEGWFYFNSLTGTSGLMGFPDLLEVTATSTTLLATYRNTPASAKWSTITATTSMALSTWHHIAIVLNGGTMTMYLNGTSVGTATTVGAPAWGGTGVQKFILGADDQYPFSGTPDVYLNGYIDDFRITNGYARYTTNFTPPAAAFPNF